MKIEHNRSVPTPCIPADKPSDADRKAVTFYYAGGVFTDRIERAFLQGSFDRAGKFDPMWSIGNRPMHQVSRGVWASRVPLQPDDNAWQWRVALQLNNQADKAALHPGVVQDGGRVFNPGRDKSVRYAPSELHRMGAQLSDDGGVTMNVWAPNARSVRVAFTDKQGHTQEFPMHPAGLPPGTGGGVWTATIHDENIHFESASHAYEFLIETSKGDVVRRPDPYATRFQGKQRGVNILHMDAQTGRPTDPCGEREVKLVNFEMQDIGDAQSVTLLFRDEAGNVVPAEALRERLGRLSDLCGIADSPCELDDHQLIKAFRQDGVSDYFADHLADDGAISLAHVAGAWSCIVPNLPALAGLRYEFCIKRSGSDHADVVKDAWDNQISETSGLSNRHAVIDAARFEFKNDATPRETDRRKWVIYQLHVGSVFGAAQNTQRSTFKDLLAHLKYFHELGVNTIELLPTNAMENTRDWGYQGASTLAAEESYGFFDDAGRFVSGGEAVRQFVDAAHGLGINVTCDVVYNHVAGDNLLWDYDGDENIYFNWGGAGESKLVETPFGVMPAFGREEVRAFYRDHALHQIQFYHFDSLRFDCSKAMADLRPEESVDGDPIDLGAMSVNAGNPGWHALREINLSLKLMKPDFHTAAEHLPPEVQISTPHAEGGLGFDQQWNPAWGYAMRDLVQASAVGAPLPVGAWMGTLDTPAGINANEGAVWIISSHDDTKDNGRMIEQTQKAGPEVAALLSRMVMVLGLLNPGSVMFFQGDESLASNRHQWGRPDTWDSGWKWRTNPETEREYARRDMHALTQAAIALRAQHIDAILSPHFEPIFCEDSGLVGYVRGNEQTKVFIVANFGGESVGIEDLKKPDGDWSEVFSSRAEARRDVAIGAHEVRVFASNA